MLLMGGDRKKYVTQILGDKEGASEREPPIHSVAKELLTCVHSSDVAGILQCLKTLFMHFDSLPHEEGEHTEG